MIRQKSVIYRFLCIWWVLITMAPRNTIKTDIDVPGKTVITFAQLSPAPSLSQLRFGVTQQALLPPPTLRRVPSFKSREEFRIFFAHRLASNVALHTLPENRL